MAQFPGEYQNSVTMSRKRTYLDNEDWLHSAHPSVTLGQARDLLRR